MLSSVINSRRAIQVNIEIMRTFIKLRRFLSTHAELERKLMELEKHLKDHDQKIQTIFEAIRLLMVPPPEPPKRKIGFHVHVDSAAIEYARKTYPEVEFTAADVMSLSEILSKRFDLIYLFNAFYAFFDHSRALEQLHRLSREAGQLIIFDYFTGDPSRVKFPFKEWNPLNISTMRSVFLVSN